jgi:hypothetical protein
MTYLMTVTGLIFLMRFEVKMKGSFLRSIVVITVTYVNDYDKTKNEILKV